VRRIENAAGALRRSQARCLIQHSTRIDSQLLSSDHQHTYFGASRRNTNQLISRSAIFQPHLLQMDTFQRLGITSRLIGLDTSSGRLHRSPLRTICRTTALVSVPGGWHKATCVPLTQQILAGPRDTLPQTNCLSPETKELYSHSLSTRASPDLVTDCMHLYTTGPYGVKFAMAQNRNFAVDMPLSRKP
jgi:hypothetical protein